MATAVKTRVSSMATLADLIERLGDIPLQRIRFHPPPGTATEEDVVAARESPERRLCELVEGVLVEKPMGTREALLAAYIVHVLWKSLEGKDLGIVLGADGMLRFDVGLVRIPDACFIPWARMPNQELPDEPIAALIPTLVVEVLSPSNTTREIERKLKEYFRAGVRLAWVINAETETAAVYSSPTSKKELGKDQFLEGGKVLPGFSLPLKKLFSRLRRRGGKAKDYLDQVGNVPLERVLLQPPPGIAKEKDLIRLLDGADKRLCELIDGVLVEKTRGYQESLIGSVIVYFLLDYLKKTDLGIALSADGPVRIRPGRVRIPDACFISWDRFPNRKLPRGAILDVVPDLAVEVISKGNTPLEMNIKLRDYFKAGTRLVWYIYPETQSALVFTSPISKRELGKDQSLPGGAVLPGFSLPLKELFAPFRPRSARQGRKK